MLRRTCAAHSARTSIIFLAETLERQICSYEGMERKSDVRYATIGSDSDRVKHFH
jgi:hypothetical protein